MILTGSGNEVPESDPLSSVIFIPSVAEGVSIVDDIDLRFPKTALIKMSCTCSCLTRKLHNRRTGAAEACLGLENKFKTIQFIFQY